MSKYEIKKSTRKNKKYDVLKDGKYLLSFGDSRYEHFKDSTPIKAYSNLNHNDTERRKNYLARHHKGVTNKTEALKQVDPESAKWWSTKYLW